MQRSAEPPAITAARVPARWRPEGARRYGRASGTQTAQGAKRSGRRAVWQHPPTGAPTQGLVATLGKPLSM
ncbi:MAG: hypothetical protein ACXVHJ_32865, partial [Solirubrobacteraceae bacterium]